MKPIELKDILQTETAHFCVKDLDTGYVCYFKKYNINSKQEECVCVLHKEIRDFVIKDNDLLFIVSDYNDEDREKFKIRCQIAELKDQIKELEGQLINNEKDARRM